MTHRFSPALTEALRRLELTCSSCPLRQYTVVRTSSHDGKWLHITRLCDACREAERMRSVSKAAVCGPVGIDANGAPCV